ncbi:MAG: hypothetical protein SFT93_05770 [Rickettsiaceae bacterium]|nr:hypothetical protein [Rickettsiaceae bacterium]
MTIKCHPLEGGDPGSKILLDSRLRGNDKKGDGNDKKGCGRQRREAGMTVAITIPSKEGIQGIWVLGF